MILQIDSDGNIEKVLSGWIEQAGERMKSTEGADLPIVSGHNFVEVPRQEILRDEDGNPQGKYPDDVETDISHTDIDSSAEYETTLKEIDNSRTKKVKLEFKVGDSTITGWAYADDSLLTAYNAGRLEVGGTIILNFIRNDLDKPYASGRVVGL